VRFINKLATQPVDMFDDVNCAGGVGSSGFNNVSPHQDVFMRPATNESDQLLSPDSALEFQFETLKNARFSLHYRAAGESESP
jgi:hypothetical protein